ncbi:MAG: DoxX family protein [Stackebrandtia sp.]
MYIATVVIAGVLALMFIASGIPKVLAIPKAVAGADHLRVGHGLFRIIGVLEILGAVGVAAGLWWALPGIAAGVGLTALMIGGVITHVKVGDPVKTQASPAFLAVLSAAYVVLLVLAA